MFSIPWNCNALGSSQSTQDIGRLNDIMSRTTRELLVKLGRKQTGSCDYNLTLINRCLPKGESNLKLEPCFNQDEVAVSWHADSCLEHFSSIGVYHFVDESEEDIKRREWRIGLRVYRDAEGPNAKKIKHFRSKDQEQLDSRIPPVAINLPTKYSYFLLDDFNHHHQHAVLAGDGLRYSSTHRVCRHEGHSFESIRLKCQSFMRKSLKNLINSLSSFQHTLDEVEFEWIRQYYVQGKYIT